MEFDADLPVCSLMMQINGMVRPLSLSDSICSNASILSSFEKTLKSKLSQKATGLASEESVLLKAFKYFDLNNNGTVEPDEFAKAVEKIGIMIPTKQVSISIVKQPYMKRLPAPKPSPLKLIFIYSNLGFGQSFLTLR